MPEHSAQATLDRIFGDLASDDVTRQLSALNELERTGYSSAAILSQLERLAIHAEGEVQKLAISALNLKTNQRVSALRTDISKQSRMLILREINTWKNSGLLEPHRADVLRRRYDFDIHEGVPVKQTVEKTAEPTEEQKVEANESAPGEAPEIVFPPRQTFTQSLLSETSIGIYLYLGAFFVISAAAILAALVESARLPILLLTTVAFAVAAIGFKVRLPQPSFAFGVVFSFLLIIDAGVIADVSQLADRSLNAYRFFVFIGMSFIWGYCTWFYESRLFSIASLLAFTLGGTNGVAAFAGSSDWIIAATGASAFAGLTGTRLLKNWKGQGFATPVFLTSQAMQVIAIQSSFSLIMVNLFATNPPADIWIAHTLTWAFAASFFAVSDTLASFILFPWLSVASLFLLPWLFLSTFNASVIVMGAGFATWGALAAFGSEITQYGNNAQLKRFGFPMLALSLPLLATAVVLGAVEGVAYAFATFVFCAIVYGFLNVLQPRWYVWTAALLAGLGAYLAFFALPFMERANFFIGFQLLLASVLLLLPELFFTGPLTAARSWNWPPVALGSVVVAFNVLVVHAYMIGETPHIGNVSIVIGVYAILAAAYALRFKSPVIGYLATASFALAVRYAHLYFESDLWLPILIALSVVYYAVGFFLARKDQAKAWWQMFIFSGLGLGALVSLGEIYPYQTLHGLYVAVVAALFIIEMFARRNGWLEIGAHIILSIAAYLSILDFFYLILGLDELKLPDYRNIMFALNLVWLGGDALFERALKERKVNLFVQLIGGGVAVINALWLLAASDSEAAIFFGMYSIFFAGYALLYRQPYFGIASTASLPLALYFGLQAAVQTSELLSSSGLTGAAFWWLLPLVALAIVYYIAGRISYRTDGNNWNSIFLFSGLGLGTFIALISPFQAGGAENALPIALAATPFAVEAFVRRDVWLAFPANGLYLISYFTLLDKLNVNEPQYFSIGAALLGLLMHYLLVRAKSRVGAFVMGMGSQLVLLGTTFIQMTSTDRLGFFLVLFAQSLVILAYGILMRSRSLVIAPIGFVALGTLSVLYSAMKGLSVVFIVGVTGITLLVLGVAAVLMRERLTMLAERFSEWNA